MKQLCLICLLSLLSLLARAQQPLVPYRVADKWGLSDTSGRMVVPATFDKIETLPADFLFKTYQGEKEGAIYKGREVIKPQNGFIYVIDGRFLTSSYSIDGQPTVGSRRMTVYNLQGRKLLPAPVMDLEPVNRELVKGEPIYIASGVNEDSRVFVYDAAYQKIKHTLISGQKGYLNHGLPPQQDRITIYHSYKGTETRKLITYHRQRRVYQVMDSKVPEVDMEVETKEDRLTSLLSPEIRNNYVIRYIQFINAPGSIRRVRAYRRYKIPGTTFDTIAVPANFESAQTLRYRQSDGYELPDHNTAPVNDSDRETIDTLFSFANYVIYTWQGRKGLIAEDYIFPAVFDSIRYFKPRNELKPYFLVSKPDSTGNTKWGVVRSDGHEILPLTYDEIKFNTEGGYGLIFILKNNGLYGLALYDGTIVKEPQFEMVSPNNLWHSVNTQNNGRYGYFDINGEYCAPLLPRKANWVTVIDGIKLLKMIDEKGDLFAYANFKGLIYYSPPEPKQ